MAISFRTLAIQSGWNSEALISCFHQSLNEVIKDELVSREEPANLEGLIALSIRIDNRICERCREHLIQDPQVVVPPLPSPVPESHRVNPRVPEVEPEPMQLGRAGLSQEERTRRVKAKACLYCGQNGHFVPLGRGKGGLDFK